MLSQLPEQADPRRLCEQGKCYEGRVALQGFVRLAPLLTSTEGEAVFTLCFGLDEDGRTRIRGHVVANLKVCCQRCMQSMELPVDAEFMLSTVSGPQEAEQLPLEYDPLLLDEHLLHPIDLVEDELILAIPPAPRHSQRECGLALADYHVTGYPQRGGESQANQKNPFAVLQKLKHDPD